MPTGCRSFTGSNGRFFCVAAFVVKLLETNIIVYPSAFARVT